MARRQSPTVTIISRQIWLDIYFRPYRIRPSLGCEFYSCFWVSVWCWTRCERFNRRACVRSSGDRWGLKYWLPIHLRYQKRPCSTGLRLSRT